MSVVRFKRTRRRLIRYYLCTDDGPVRLPLRLSRDLADRVIALPHFANSVQRMVEVLIESKAGKIQKIELRPTHNIPPGPNVRFTPKSGHVQCI
jgi:hypothetical protein